MSTPQRVIIFDTETTGLAPGQGDRIVEIGAVELIGRQAGREFHRYINPQRDVPEEVVKVHGLTGHFLATKGVLFADICAELLEFFGDDPVVAHNAEFDRAFLNAELERCGVAAFPRERFVDTLDEARKILRAGTRLSLDSLSKHFGLHQTRIDSQRFDLTARKGPGGHGALLDAKMLAEIYVELMGGREQKLFAAEAAEEARVAAEAIVVRAAARVRMSPMELLSNAEERAKHAAFVGKLSGGTSWGYEAPPT